MATFRSISIIATIIAAQVAAQSAYSQIRIVDEPVTNNINNSDPNKIFVACEKMPEYPGGSSQLQADVKALMKYPKNARKKKIEGRVIVQFVVEKDGSIGDVKVVRGKDPSLDKEAVRIIKNLKQFTPGRMGDTPVRVWYTYPIDFRIE